MFLRPAQRVRVYLKVNPQISGHNESHVREEQRPSRVPHIYLVLRSVAFAVCKAMQHFERSQTGVEIAMSLHLRYDVCPFSSACFPHRHALGRPPSCWDKSHHRTKWQGRYTLSVVELIRPRRCRSCCFFAVSSSFWMLTFVPRSRARTLAIFCQ